MDQLPVELLEMICQLLCAHCQHPDVFLHGNDQAAIEDQRALARLCRTSKVILAVAQRFLYHYFSDTRPHYIKADLFGAPLLCPPRWPSRVYPTKNYPPDYVTKTKTRPDVDAVGTFAAVGPPIIPLPYFLHTITQRPDLAAQVTSMHLTTWWNANRKPHALPAGRVTPWTPWVIEDILQRIRFNGSAKRDTVVERQLAIYATALCPRLESLLLEFDEYLGIPDKPYDMFANTPRLYLPSLRRLALDSRTVDSWDIYVKELLDAAWNLDALYVPLLPHHGNSFPSRHLDWYARPFKVHLHVRRHERGREDLEHSHEMLRPLHDGSTAMTSLRSLSIADANAPTANEIIKGNPQLEELVYHYKLRHQPSEQPQDLQLHSIRHTLKKLYVCVQATTSETASEWGWPTCGSRNLYMLPELRSLNKLEHLALDCRGLWGPPGSKAAKNEWLAEILPPSIRTLRIGWIYRSMEAQLIHLAVVAPNEFSLLKKVGLSIAAVSEYPPEPEEDNIEDTKAVGPLFVGNGIKFGWMVDPMDIENDAIVPLAEHMRIKPELPEFPLTLEGPEWHLCV